MDLIREPLKLYERNHEMINETDPKIITELWRDFCKVMKSRMPNYDSDDYDPVIDANFRMCYVLYDTIIMYYNHNEDFYHDSDYDGGAEYTANTVISEVLHDLEFDYDIITLIAKAVADPNWKICDNFSDYRWHRFCMDLYAGVKFKLKLFSPTKELMPFDVIAGMEIQLQLRDLYYN